MNEQLYTTTCILNWSLSNVNIYLKTIVTKLCKNNKLFSYQTLVFMFKMSTIFIFLSSVLDESRVNTPT